MKVVKRLLTKLSSPIFTMFILVLFFFILMVGGNPWFKFQYEDPQGFYRSWIFITVIVVLFIALLVCTLKQTARLLRSEGRGGPSLKEFKICSETDIFGLMESICAFVKNKGFRVQTRTDYEITCIKKKSGIWGSVIFHLGLILICCGIFVELGFAFSGRMGMVSGQLFDDRLGSYNYSKAGPFNQHKGGAFSLYLHDIKTKYKQTGVFASADTSLVVEGTEVSRQDIAAGTPLKYRLWNVAFGNFGYYVKTLLKIDDKEYPLDIGLSTTVHSDNEKYSESFNLKETPFRIDIEFIPDVKLKGKSYKPEQPAVKLDVWKTEKGRDSQVYRGTVRLGEAAVFDRSSRLMFTGFYPWVMFEAKMEPGLYIIYAGFITSLLGLVLLYVWVPEYINLKFIREGGQSKAVIGGYKPRYRQEFQQYLADINKELIELLAKEGFHGPVA